MKSIKYLFIYLLLLGGSNDFFFFFFKLRKSRLAGMVSFYFHYAS